MGYLDEAKTFYTERLRPYFGTPRGCTSNEIDELETQIGFCLPEAYREYLAWMGRHYGGVFSGTDCFIDHVIEITKYLPEVLRDNSIYGVLPPAYLAISSHQGYVLHWIELPKIDDNPPVYLFAEREPPMDKPQIAGTFSEWLFSAFREIAEFYRPEDLL